jgi:hypothetical protein
MGQPDLGAFQMPALYSNYGPRLWACAVYFSHVTLDALDARRTASLGFASGGTRTIGT